MMRASLRRKNFFILDCFLILAVTAVSSFAGWGFSYPRTYYFIFQFSSYLFFLFLFSALFLNLSYQKFNLDQNFRALAYGVSAAAIASVLYCFMFLKARQTVFVYRTVFSGVSLFMLLGVFRYLEWKYVWPAKKFTVILLGGPRSLEYYLKDIVLSLRPSDEILITGMEDLNWSERPSADKRIKLISVEDAYGVIDKNRDLSSVVLGTNILNDQHARLLSLCYKKSLTVIGLELFYEIICRKLPLFKVEGRWMAHLTFMRPSLISAFIKRSCDIFLAFTLLIASLPLWFIIALLVKSSSKGPVFFKQNRLGYGGRPFVLLKFRTMRPHEDDSDRWPNFEADLVTRPGRFFRRTGLDELPQLINILRGEMSFVGPRAARPAVAERHMSRIPPYSMILCLRPGISGWAQIHQGQDTGDETVLEKVKYNLYYAKNNSFFLDMEIILKTIRLFFMRKKPRRAEIGRPAETKEDYDKSCETVSGARRG